jgi:hypothetical protein
MAFDPPAVLDEELPDVVVVPLVPANSRLSGSG